MKQVLATAAAAALCIGASATVPHRLAVPDIPGYTTLKGDFHVHTVFSDDTSWPTGRIDEAYYDGLDVISITDHCDTRHRHMVKEGWFDADKCTRNASYEIASKHARKYGIIVLHGAELTRGARLFPGHFNAHFIQDGDLLATEMEKEDGAISDPVKKEEEAIVNGLKEGRRQGGFLVWNHPNWEPQEPNEIIWHEIQERVWKAGLMDGIEIENHSVGYCPEAFHMAMERNLTIVSGTDCHKPMNQLVDYEAGEYRSYTLLFAKERSEKGVREALDNHRTAVYVDNAVYGKEEFLRPLLEACLQNVSFKATAGKVTVSLKNVSGIPVRLRKAPGSENVVMNRVVIISPGEEISLSFSPVRGAKKFDCGEISLNYYVDNFQTDADTPLLVCQKVRIPAK